MIESINTIAKFNESFPRMPVNCERDNGIKIQSIILPSHTLHDPLTTVSAVTASSKHQAIAVLEQLENELLQKEIDFFQKANKRLNEYVLEASDQAAVMHLLNLIKELSKGKLDFSTAFECLKWNLRLTLMQLKRQSTQLECKIQQFARRISTQNYKIELRECNGHSPSYFLVDKTTKKPFAILKQSDQIVFSSFKRDLIPDFPIEALGWENEIIGYEQDQLFGLDHTPITLGVQFLSEENSVTGIIQEYVSNSMSGGDLYTPQGAELLKSIPPALVHAITFSGMFKGLAAAHMNNVIMQTEITGSKESIKAIYEIDLEEMLLPYNRLTEAENLSVGPTLSLNIQSLTLCRLWILGLPQNTLPFERTTLLSITHPSLLHLLEQYQQKARTYSRVLPESWKAQYERVKHIQSICTEELKKEAITLTPRLLYFAIFGGESLWQLGEEFHYPDMIISNNLVSDPYQHIIKDFSNPRGSMSVCRRLEKPKEYTKKSLDITNFFRVMVNMPPKTIPFWPLLVACNKIFKILLKPFQGLLKKI